MAAFYVIFALSFFDGICCLLFLFLFSEKIYARVYIEHPESVDNGESFFAICVCV